MKRLVSVFSLDSLTCEFQMDYIVFISGRNVIPQNLLRSYQWALLKRFPVRIPVRG